MNILLWVIQVLLAALFVFAGGSKLITPIEEMTSQMPVSLPGWFLRFIGVAELLGGLGLVLPALFRVRQGLTPLAASGLVIIMAGATVITLVAAGAKLAAIPFVVGLLLVWVAFARSRPTGAGA